MRTILITAGTSPLSRRIAKGLSNSAVYFAAADAGSFFDSENFRSIPSSTSSIFVHEILKVCLDLSIEVLIPLEKNEIKILSQQKTLFQEYGIEVLLPSLEELEGLKFAPNPNRTEYPELQINFSQRNSEMPPGVYVVTKEGELALCCVPNK